MSAEQRRPGLHSLVAWHLAGHQPVKESSDIGFRKYLHVELSGGKIVAVANIAQGAAFGSPVWAGEKERTMAVQLDTPREILLVEAAHIRPMMGIDILESLPSAHIPYRLVDPFILVHEGDITITPQRAGFDTKHPHRGFDNLWYLIKGEASTGHSTGPGGAFERARLKAGSLLKIRTGRGVWHAEGLGEDELREGKAGTEMRGLLFWVNLARKDKNVEPTAQIVRPNEVPVRKEGDATIRVLVGQGSPVELGTPGLILDVDLPTGGTFSSLVPGDFNGFVYMLEGEASFGADLRSASRSQIDVLGPGDWLPVAAAC